MRVVHPRAHGALAHSPDGSSNTRDQLRGAHDRTTTHDDRADHDAPTRLQPPLVSCIALLGGSSLALTWVV
jgi:hypothetical protein